MHVQTSLLPSAGLTGYPVLVLYDGVCAMCNAMVQVMVRLDRDGVLRFAAQQGELGQVILQRHGIEAAAAPETVYAVIAPGQPDEQLLGQSAAAFTVLGRLDPPWRWLALLARLPRRWTDAVYRLIARNRYRWFGQYDACPLPPPHVRVRFLD